MLDFPYRDDENHLACDIDINARLEAAGHSITTDWRGDNDRGVCFGTHGAHYTPMTAYMAYYNRALTSRLHQNKVLWMQELPSYFREQMRAEPNNPIHLYSLLGYVAGLNVSLDMEHCRKDYRMVDEAFVRIKAELERTCGCC